MTTPQEHHAHTPCTPEEWQAEADLCFGGSLELLRRFMKRQIERHRATWPLAKHLRVCRQALNAHLGYRP